MKFKLLLTVVLVAGLLAGIAPVLATTGCSNSSAQSIAEADTPKLIATRCDPRTVVLGRGAPGS